MLSQKGDAMKIFWKIFFAFMTVIPLFFGVFGYILISRSFQDSYELEVEDCKKECRTFWLTFEMNLQVMDEEEMDADSVKNMAEGLVQNLDYKTYDYAIYNEDGEEIYRRGATEKVSQTGQETSDVEKSGEKTTETGEENSKGKETENGDWQRWKDATQDQKLAWQMYRENGKNYLQVVCSGGKKDAVYYLETVKDITKIYEKRDSLIGNYQMLLGALLVCTGILTLVMSHLLSRNIVKLSQLTRMFTAGDYTVRADIRGGDETGMLAEDFNQMGDSLVEKVEELTDAARRQEEFSASFAHELKTPLTSIIGYADMLRTMEMPEEERMETADYIFRQGKRLESLSRKLLELIVTGQETIGLQDIRTERLTSQLDILVKHAMEEKGIEFTTDVEKVILHGEGELLVSLLGNLLDNARKAVEPGGHIQLRGRLAEERYIFTVQDDGIGMEEEQIRHLTEPFYRVDKSRARKNGGAGLGLTLCQKIVELHQGSLEICSEPGEGTVVSVSLPVSPQEKLQEVEEDA